MDSKRLEELKQKFKKNTEVCEIFEHFESLLASPYYDGFVTIKTQLLTWQSKIKSGEVRLTGLADDKAFERAHKFLTELKPYYDQLEYFRGKLTPEEVKTANVEATSAYEIAVNAIEKQAEGE